MIPMVNLRRQLAAIKDELEQAVREVIESTHYVLGPRVEEFERKVAEYCGTADAVGVASGTDALHMSMSAQGIGPGDEVITTPFTFFSTAEAIAYEGAKPVFVDIDPQTFNMDPALVEEKITEKTRAILPVHMFGHPADMGAIMDIARRHGLAVIEDCAQAFGAEAMGRKVGSFGEGGCFSFYPSKNLGGCGDGGMVVTNDVAVAEKLRSLRNHGSRKAYVHDRIGFNSRLDELQAAILLVKFSRIDEYNEGRRKNADIYSELLGDKVECPSQRDGFKHVYHQYTVMSPRRDEIRNTLSGAGIGSALYYPVPLHLQEALSYLGHKEGDFPVAERVCREVLSLPMCPELQESEIRRIAETVLSV